jgi:predicted Fe-Mo cluster-binding NifX family protein
LASAALKNWLKYQDTDAVIAGSAGETAQRLLENLGIQVIKGTYSRAP